MHMKEGYVTVQKQSLSVPSLFVYVIAEPRHEKTCLGFPARSSTNWAVQPQVMVRGLNFTYRM